MTRGRHLGKDLDLHISWEFPLWSVLPHVFPLFAAPRSQDRRSHQVLWHGWIPGPWLGELHCLPLVQSAEAFHVPLAHKVILGVCGGGVHTILTRGWGQGDMDRKPNLMHVSSHLQMSVPRSSWDSSATWAVTSLLLAFLLHLRPPCTSSTATCKLLLGSRARGRRLRLWAWAPAQAATSYRKVQRQYTF